MGTSEVGTAVDGMCANRELAAVFPVRHARREKRPYAEFRVIPGRCFVMR